MPSCSKSGAIRLATALASVCALSCALAGCGPKKVQAAAPVAVAPAASESKPLTNIAPDTDALPPSQNVPTPPNPVA
ncbi:MAG: hypothetical protein WCA00_22045, partial [Candidatus Acidiferrales bacterium]